MVRRPLLIVAALVFVEFLLPFPVGHVVPVRAVVAVPPVGVLLLQPVGLRLPGGQGIPVAGVFLPLGPGQQVIFVPQAPGLELVLLHGQAVQLRDAVGQSLQLPGIGLLAHGLGIGAAVAPGQGRRLPHGIGHGPLGVPDGLAAVLAVQRVAVEPVLEVLLVQDAVHGLLQGLVVFRAVFPRPGLLMGPHRLPRPLNLPGGHIFLLLCHRFSFIVSLAPQWGSWQPVRAD